MKNLFQSKKFRAILISLAAVLVAAFVSVAVYKGINGIYALEKQIDAMAELMSPTKADIESFEAAYARLSPIEKKFVSNYDDYQVVHDAYIEALIDAFSDGEAYVELYEAVMNKLSKHVNAPTIELDKENRRVNINMTAGPDTENQLINDPASAQEYLQVVLDDMVYATASGFEITSLYGLDIYGVVTTDESNGMEVIRVKNGAVEYYIAGEN